eukprot:CAMPEP_0177776296 /NCGR_PEP_ID=MMETSP0491_2-20121128/14632_1 /TAXON_ID=63592 /ORGANISM="Tetraselmis chuii, Strain PLY429" /LENGTH=263 /DNA_ID=CAMNT_0019295067 /DNA_START=321 /DNA_END=1111 /DNA_ORIENTATION=-
MTDGSSLLAVQENFSANGPGALSEAGGDEHSASITPTSFRRSPAGDVDGRRWRRHDKMPATADESADHPQHALLAKVPFRSGLFDCFSDMSTCCYGFFCPYCIFGENVKTMQMLDVSKREESPSCFGPCWTIMTSTNGAAATCLTTQLICFLAATQGLCCGCSGAVLSAATDIMPASALALGTVAMIAGRTRGKLRSKYGLRNSHKCAICLSTDFRVHCALCQEARELKAILAEKAGHGYHGSSAEMMPPPTQYMATSDVEIY